MQPMVIHPSKFTGTNQILCRRGKRAETEFGDCQSEPELGKAALERSGR
jgi:hypothetical protein